MLTTEQRRKDGLGRSVRWVLPTTILASSLAFIDGSVVNVALPAIGRGFADAAAALSWVVNAYLLPLSALLLAGGAAGDRYGRRRVLIIGVALFLAASALCAAAPDLPVLLLARACQGVGAAMVLPNSLALLAGAFEGEARGRAIGIWAAVGAGAGAIGPVLGGWLVDIGSWRLVFLINLPIAALTIFLAAKYLADEDFGSRSQLDWLGAALATIALGLLTWALDALNGPDANRLVGVIGLFTSALLFVGFVLHQRQRGAAAMLPLSLFQSRPFVSLSLLTLLLYGALGGMLVLVPYLLIEARDYSATAAGAALLPLPITIAIASPTMGRLAAKVGPRWLLALGPLVTAVGFLLAQWMPHLGSYWATIFPALLLMAVGMSAAVAPLTTAVLASVPMAQAGVASGFNSAIARTGGLIATALLGSILVTHGASLTTLFSTAAYCGAAVAAAAGACGIFSAQR